MSDSLDLRATLLLTEYEQMKGEQVRRIGVRDNLIYVTLAGSATVLAVALTQSMPLVLLAVPIVGLVMGLTFVLNDRMITAIGDYIRGPLRASAADLSGADSATFGVFGWEEYHRVRKGRHLSKSLQLGRDVSVFVAPALTALAFAVASEGRNAAVWITAGLECLGLIFLLVLLLQGRLGQREP